MARSRVELNRSRLDTVQAGFADGVFDLARAIVVVGESRAPWAKLPLHRLYHLDEMGGAELYVQGKRTHEYSSNPSRRPNLPKGMAVRARGGIIGIAGFGFPGNFVELGTVKMRAQPFLTPAAAEVLGSDAKLILSKAMEARLRGERSPNTPKIKARIAASRAARAGGG